ncbi:MAG: PVC-type heme-binding CxxCH protein [Chryseolinea sp.]
MMNRNVHLLTSFNKYRTAATIATHCAARLIVIACAFLCLQCAKEDNPAVVSDLYVPDDLESTLWAESPMFHNPTNIDVDLKGRIWITEAVNYRNFNNDSTRILHHQNGDRVMILEDRNHDGKADTAKVFVQDKDLVSPLGIAVIGDKVIVSCSPHIIIYTDSNGDDAPDKKEIFLTGFGGKDHDHSLHAVVAGPDGNWYFNTGNAGPHIVGDRSGWTLRAGSIYTGGSPYNTANHGQMKSDDGKTWVGGLSLRIGEDGKGLKVMGHNFRNSYETTMDSYGNLWQNDNDDQVVACRTSWLAEGGNAGYFSTDGTRYWQGDQRPGQDIFSAHWHQDDPGVMPAGDNSGAGAPTGIAIYEGNALGEKYNGMLFSADAGRNVVFAYKPTRSKSGYDLGPRNNFVTTLPSDNAEYVWNDSAQMADDKKWFRPSDVVVGTDGTLYVADWYDPVVGGHQMKDSTGYGRIYRIKPKGNNPRPPIYNLDNWTGLIDALKSPAIHVRAIAREKIKARGEAGIAPLKDLLESKFSFERARATWLLAALGPTGQNEVVRLLTDPDEMIRATAFRALRQVPGHTLKFAEKMAKDTSAFVRREVAVGLRDLPFNQSKKILLTLAGAYSGNDKWYLQALSSACKGNEAEFYQCLQDDGVIDKDPLKWDFKMSALACELHPATIVDELKIRASSRAIAKPHRAAAVTALAFINTTHAVHAMVELTRVSLDDVAAQANYWLAFRQGNDWFSLLDWKQSGIDINHRRNVDDMQVRMSKVLNDRLPFDERKWNAQAMAKDAVGGQMLLKQVMDKKVMLELFPSIEEVIFKNPDIGVRIQASAFFAKPGTKKSYSIPAISKMVPNTANGRALFMKNCTACHRIENKGSEIGPDLTLIKKKFDRPAVLDAIINPSAGMVFGYEPWLITTKTGESFFGLLVADGDKTLVVKDLTGRRHVIATTDVASRRKQENSLMPEPTAFALTEQDLADISAYLITLQ